MTLFARAFLAAAVAVFCSFAGFAEGGWRVSVDGRDLPLRTCRAEVQAPYQFGSFEVKGGERVVVTAPDGKHGLMQFDLDEDDGFFLAQDANYDGTEDGKGLGPCLMLVDMRKVEKATTTIGVDKRDVGVSCTLKPDFGKVRFGVWEDRAHRHSNEETYQAFLKNRRNF